MEDKERGWEMGLCSCFYWPNHHHLLLGASLPISASSQDFFPWGPTHIALLTLRLWHAEFSLFLSLSLHTDPFHCCKLSHWQSPKENKCSVSSLWVGGILSSRPKFPWPGLTHPTGANLPLAQASWVPGPRLIPNIARAQPPEVPRGQLRPTSQSVASELPPFRTFPGRILRAAKCPSGTIGTLLMRGMFIAL